MYPKHALSLLWVLGLHMALIPRGFSPYAAAVYIFSGASYSEPEAEARDVARPSDYAETSEQTEREVYEMLESEDNSGQSELNSRKRRSVELLHMGSDFKRSTNSDVPGVVLGRNKRSLPTATEGLGLEERGKRAPLSVNYGMEVISQYVQSERKKHELIQQYRDLQTRLKNAGKKRSLLISTDDMNKRDDLTSSVTSKMEAIGAMVKRKRED